jgi:hypothetical protein
MKTRISAAALGVAVLAGANAANAETLRVTWDESGAVMASWLQSSDPTPLYYTTGFATEVPIADLTGQVGSATSIGFFTVTPTNNGGFQIAQPPPAPAWDVAGPQMYTGSEAAPIFAPGVFAVQDHTNGFPGISSTVSFTVAVPEPPVWSLMIAGMAFLGAWRRFGRAARSQPDKAC